MILYFVCIKILLECGIVVVMNLIIQMHLNGVLVMLFVLQDVTGLNFKILTILLQNMNII